MKPSTTATEYAARPNATSWLPLIAPIAAWSAQELVSFYVTAVGCERAHASTLRALLIGIAVLALATTVFGTLAGYRNFRSIAAEESIARDEGREREEMVALVSVLLGIVLTLAVVWGALPPLLVSNMCGARA